MEIKLGDLVVFIDEAYDERRRRFEVYGVKPSENLPLVVKKINKSHPDEYSTCEAISSVDDSSYRVPVCSLRHATTMEIKLHQLKNMF